MEIIGVILLLTLSPAGLLMWFTAWVRSNEVLFADIRSQMDAPAELGVMRYQFGRYWPVAASLGFAYAVY